MRSLLVMAILLNLSAACSKPPATTMAPPSASDPKGAGTVPASPPPAATPTRNATPVYLPTSNPGYVVVNQADPPFQIPTH
jgi:hypothetical protein